MLVEDAMEVDNGQGRNTEEVIFDEEKVQFVYLLNKLSACFVLLLIVCLSEFQVAQLKELSKQPDIYERLTKSLAPNIWELDDVKKGLLCQVTHIFLATLSFVVLFHKYSEDASFYFLAAFWWQCFEVGIWC
jgi:hypothetical protein